MNALDIRLELNWDHPPSHFVLHRLRDMQHTLSVYSIIPESAFVRGAVSECERSSTLFFTTPEYSFITLTILADLREKRRKKKEMPKK